MFCAQNRCRALSIVSAGGRLLNDLRVGSFLAVAQGRDGSIYALIKDNGVTAFTPSGSFGQATATRDARQAQFGMKLIF